MSSQHFEKNIIDKLNEYPLEPDAKAWSRIRPKLQSPKWLLWFRKIGIPAYILLSSLTLGWLIWRQEDAHNHAMDLEKKFSGRDAELESLQKGIAMERAKNQVLENSLASIQAKLNEQTQAPTSEYLEKNSIQRNQYFTAPPTSESRNQLASRNSNAVRQQTVSKQAGRKLQISTETSSIVSSQVAGNETTSSGSVQTIDGTTEDVVRSSVASVPVTIHDTITREVTVVKNDTVYVKNTESPSAKTSLISRIQPRIGVEYLTNYNDLRAFGMSAEFSLAKNFGFSVGVLAYRPVKAGFANENTFNEEFNKDFRAEYAESTNGLTALIEDIKVNTMLIEIPLRFKYYMPIHKDWHLLFGGGTQLNVYHQQELSCITRENNQEVFHAYGHTPTPALFHNFVFNTGIQYEHKDLLFQLTPYYQYNFQPIEYLEKSPAFGTSFSAWYRFH
ncbi:MAG TPA: hypothetical protein PLK63_13165 [Catalimonadaceae bacterium]|nr:hypothetical protein [Catalimonadaceae bacterium]